MDFTSRYCRRRVESSLSCPSSSLGLNCFQFAWCIPTIPSIDFPINLYPDWMTNLVQSRPDVTIGDMVIPGSHDSASYSIDGIKPFAAVGRTQNVPVVEQLHRGVRYLDLRVAGGAAGKNGSPLVSIWHGCLQGSQLENVLEDIRSFCEDFPGEFLVVEVVAEYGRSFQPGQKKKCLDLVKDYLGDKLYTNEDLTDLFNTPLKDVMGSDGAQICVLVHPRMYEEKFECDGVDYSERTVATEYGFHDSCKWMSNQWHNTRDTSQLFDWNLEEIKSVNGSKDKFRNNQFVFTPGVGGFPDAVKLLLGSNSLQPVYLAGPLYTPPKKHDTPPLHKFLQQNCSESWNIVSLDYIDLCPAVLSVLIGMNFATMEVALATVQYGNPNFFRPSMSVTSKVQSHVLRDRALFLNVGKDFGSNFGTLTMIYKIHDAYYVIVIHFDGSSTIVLNEYNHLQAGSREVICEESKDEGEINPGGGGTIMKWARVDGKIEFSFDTPF